jgi:GAF domain-containing protein
MEFYDYFVLFMTSITSIIVALIGKDYFRKKEDKKKKDRSKEDLMEQIEKDEIVHLALRDIRRQFNTDRIYIWQFHNGGNFHTESSMQKASITYERCSDGLERKSEKYQGVLVSLFAWYMKQVMMNKAYFLNMEDIEDIGIRSICSGNGTKSHVATPMFDDKNHLIGILCLDWVFSQVPSDIVTDDQFNDEFIQEINQLSNSLKTYL